MPLSDQDKEEIVNLIDAAIKSGAEGQGFLGIEAKLKQIAKEKIGNDTSDKQLDILKDLIAHARRIRPIIFMGPKLALGEAYNKSKQDPELSFLLRCGSNVWGFYSDPKALRNELFH